MKRAFIHVLLLGALGLSCQDYPFETRENRTVEALEIKEQITTVKPSDIIFVIDNSGSMLDELKALRANLRTFVNLLSESQNDYRIGIITPDVECNIPDRSCGSFGTSSDACCNRPGGTPLCTESDTNGDGALDVSTCDGGRLRSISSRRVSDPNVDRNRFFARPKDTDRELWLKDIDDTLLDLGCDGSGYEAGLEAVRRAVVCSLDEATRTARGLRVVDENGDVVRDACPDQRIHELNRGFIRDQADLVIIFVSDEDDCSFSKVRVAGEPAVNSAVPLAFQRPEPASDAVEQAQKLCNPVECYGYHGQFLDADQDNILDWLEQDPSLLLEAQTRFTCVTDVARVTYPPLPESVDTFLDDIVAAKQGIERVRAGGILGGIRTSAASGHLGFQGVGCFFDAIGSTRPEQRPGASQACGCWANSGGGMYCRLTELQQANKNRTPVGSDILTCGGAGGAGGAPEASPGGCVAMTGGRYVDFLNLVAERRLTAGQDLSVLVDSICQPQYEKTMQDIVGTIFPQSCFNLGMGDIRPEEIEIRLNGALLNHVAPGSGLQGWTQPEGSTDICLVNLGDVDVGDRFEIFLMTNN